MRTLLVRLVVSLSVSGLVLSPRASSADTLVLPGVARASGVGGARFVSVLWLYNPSDAAQLVELALVSVSGTAAAPTLALGPHESRRVDDPVGTLFGLELGAGAVLAVAPGPLVLRGVTANVADPRGTYGLALVAGRVDEALRAGETGTAVWLTHTAVAGTGFRTNVAVTLLEPDSEALVTILDDTGIVRGEERISSREPLFWQRSAGELSPDPEIPLGRVEVRVLRGAAVAYTAVVDNVTGDGLLAPARRLDAAPASAFERVVAGAARAPGANGTLWRTGLRLVNPGVVPVDVSMDAPGAARAFRAIPPRGVLEESDVLGALGLGEGSAGAVHVTSASPLSALAVTRNVDPSGRPGTFAASQELLPDAAFAGAGGAFVFVGLRADSGGSGFRTNVAFLAGAEGAGARLVLRSPAGVVLSLGSLALGPSAWSQKTLPDWVGASSVPPDDTLEVEVLSGSLTGYASVIDNGTGDPVVLAPAAVPSAACSPSAPRALLSTPTTRVLAGDSVVLHLEAPGRGPGVLLPGGVSLAPGGSVTVSPAVTTTFRWRPSTGCAGDASPPLAIEVVAPAGSVMTEQGTVRGTAGGGAVAYRGIPFAAPPIGALRWRPPAPPASFAGVRDAAAFGSVCPQLDLLGHVVGAEDCLTLNVFAPEATPPQPFLSAESRRGVSGNWGALDQLAAIRWARRNVAAFGGDPSRIAIFGESAGGVNVCSLATSPLAKGLFTGALVESGGCIQKPLADFYEFGAGLVADAGCASAADPAGCMRAVSSEALLLALPPKIDIVKGSGQLWGPAVEGFVLPESPHLALAHGARGDVAFAVGANADEAGAAIPVNITEGEYHALLAAQFGLLSPLVLAKYPVSAYPTPREAYVAVATDSRFVCPSRRYARAAASGGSGKVFRYFFSYPANALFGAVHASELAFVFGSFSALPGSHPDAAALALSEAMNAAWARFAATGDPNGPGAPAWPLYDAAADATLVWNAPATAVNGVRGALCDFWDIWDPFKAPE